MKRNETIAALHNIIARLEGQVAESDLHLLTLARAHLRAHLTLSAQGAYSYTDTNTPEIQRADWIVRNLHWALWAAA
jgi:hypothetical protein